MSNSIEEAQRRLTAKLMGRFGVSAIGIGADAGKPCLKIFVSGDEGGGRIPRNYKGHRVKVVKAGQFRAQSRSGAARAGSAK